MTTKPPKKRQMCRHCKVNIACRPKGLCWKDYYSPARDLYETTSKFANRGHGHHAGLGLRPLPTPTLAEPGSEEKVLVLIERCKNGEALHHPDDVMFGPPEPPVEIREAPFPFGNGMLKLFDPHEIP